MTALPLFPVLFFFCSLFNVALAEGSATLPVASSSIVYSESGGQLFTANFDAGSVTRATLSNTQNKLENTIGRDIRRLALGLNERQILATDTLGEQLFWLDANTLEIDYQLNVQGRPFGVVYDISRKLYWVTLFEASLLLGVDTEGQIIVKIETPETPRGLALTADGRLLMTHAMTGQLSVWSLASDKPLLSKLITLEETSNSDEFVSQGQPRLLDDIAISPDGHEAWLPHVLWNFDHPFQFQSTIFPAISIVSLTPGEEAEKIGYRKELFQQINIIDNGNRTRIVSNPHDAEFSPDGKKVYVTLAGSEDLMVFDRSRANTGNKKRSKRRKGKLPQGGAKVNQILRPIPGDNPRGLLLNGGSLFVQNAMSHDVVRLDRGGDSPFSRVSVAEAPLYKTVSKDPLSAELRQGVRLFNQANTGEDKAYPMAGDFWMSCNSCHLDGFNFTNQYLVEGRNENKKENAVLGHGNLNKMVAGDFLRDYVRMIQDTQGGMGHDDRDGAKPIDAATPDSEVYEMMGALHRYITASHNLPYLANWLRLEDGTRRTVHKDEWINSAACESCHSDMFEQWVDSNHRLMSESNPYYRIMEDLAAATEGEAFRAWCSGCHNPERVLVGLPFRGHGNDMFEKQGSSLKEALAEGKHGPKEGTGCLFCHRISRLEDVGGNAAMTVNLKDREQYVFENSSNPVLRWLGESQINAKPEVHKQSYSQPFYKDEQYCKSCHNEFSPGLGAMVVDTWGEWEKSSFNDPENPEKHRGCIACHMHGDISKIGEDVPGISTDGGRVKKNVVTHQFTGANHFLVGLRNPELEKMSIELLKTSASLEQSISDNQLTVRVNNIGAGHALPTGVADFREFWLQVTAVDATGQTVFKSGYLDEAGNIGTDARVFMKVFGDKEGKPLGLIFWRYEKLLKDTRIPADGYRDEIFELPSDAVYPLQVESKLMYRIYPQWVTNAVKAKVPELTDPPVLELNRIEGRFTQ
ncbi:YncE family protein [Alkalimarinus alittae]|uniref:Cytochrome c-552/4 domain-containing protein n=1 Tax=Alkalimarinus alittae TaxID=2961619 RepID=A0ABY6N1C3_9ALTE|nr:hypothetical protein [Alkalimarinus alittae]UZE95900.1 hypothetical protein NKI27_17915 [Alkalimarinus alittae]